MVKADFEEHGMKFNADSTAPRKVEDVEPDWQHIAEELWQLLDDIDTAADIFKPATIPSWQTYFGYVTKKHEQRFEYITSNVGGDRGLLQIQPNYKWVRR